MIAGSQLQSVRQGDSEPRCSCSVLYTGDKFRVNPRCGATTHV